MKNKPMPLRSASHPSSEDLLCFMDRELSAVHYLRVGMHLAFCPDCRNRVSQMKRASGEFAQLRQLHVGQNFPPADQPRRRLQLQLRTQNVSVSKHSVPPGWFMPQPRWLYACSSVAFVFFCAAALYWFALNSAGFSAAVALSPVPKPNLTPGAIMPVSAKEICGIRSAIPSNAIPPALEKQVLVAYGIVRPKPGAYEVDYLITPELGGATSVRNLWPEPYANTLWNAHVKDQLETHLHSLVCAGDLQLSTAQQDLAANWISAYKKYFHAQQPLPDQSASLRPMSLFTFGR
jgi:hypothetical protein